MSNPYSEAIETLLAKVAGQGPEPVAQRRILRRAIKAVNEVWEAEQIGGAEFGPTCFRCGRSPEQIPGLVFMAEDEDRTPADFAREDGTYNEENGHFACDECYIAIGMPASPDGWKAP